VHAGFALDSDGDGVYLFDSPANGQVLLDSVTFGIQIGDYSIGRTGAGRDVWTLCTPTIGTANAAVASFGAPGALKINEWAGNRDYLLGDDFVELYNPEAQPVALGQMVLTDDFVNYPAKAILPDLSFIGPGAFLRFFAKGSSASDGNATELPFRIGADFGLLALLGQNRTIVDRVDVVAQAADTSRGRTPDGAASVTTFGLPTTIPTPGAANVPPPASVLALIGNLRISELLYSPTNLEYIELHNTGDIPLDLSGVRFTQGLTYIFDQGVMLAPGAYLVVCRDRAAFQAQFGGGVPLAAGTFSGSLDNAGETIAIQPPVPWNVNILNFRYDPAWFSPDTNNGFALTVIDDLNTFARDWNERRSWSPSPTLYGTPGADSAPTITSPLVVAAYTDRALSYQIAATKSPTAFNASPLPNGLSVDTNTGLISGTPSATGVFPVTLSATNGIGTGTRTLSLTVTTSPPPIILSSGIASGIVNSPLTYQIVATNSPTEYGANGLPPGMSVNTLTGLLSGTPTQTGTFDVTLTATNAFGTAQKALALSVRLPAAPVITSAQTTLAVLNDPFTYQITGVSNPTSYGASGLPSGLTVNTSNGLISGAPTATGTFNVILSAANSGGTGMRGLLLTVNSSGPLAAFAWSAIDSPQKAGVPFAATLETRDAQGRTVREFNGGFTIKGQGAGSTAAIVLITECGTGTNDYFEIENVGNIPANTAGWFIVPNNAPVGVNAANAAWPLPASIAPGQVIAITENTPGVYPTQIDWSSGFGGNQNGWCMLCDGTGAVRDFVGWGYTAAQITSINVPTITVGGSTYTNITVPATQWTGNGAGAGFNTGIKSRTGTSDANTAANWTTANSESNKGLQNTGLTVPFLPPPPVVQVSPGSATFFRGVWTGNIAIPELATGMRVVATDNAGHAANSNTFDTVAPPPPVINSPATARGVVGGPFSYQILGTNFPTGFDASGLSAGLNVSTSSGVISGTPTAPGVINVTIMASNLGGTGSGSTSITIEADADGDGMGDTWEAANGLNNTVNDAAGDVDRDGQTNLEEWFAGTVPNDALSRFTVSDSQFVNGNFVIRWTSAIGKRYRVFTRSDLNLGSWIDITPTPVTATGAETSFSHAGGAIGLQRFYRVSVEP
jgi:hypothetical protein